MEEKMTGRQWVVRQKDSSIFKQLTQIPAVQNGYCQRCGSEVTASLPNGRKYCRGCIGIGRLQEGDYLVRNLTQAHFLPVANGGLTWQGRLTAAQSEISQQLVANFLARKNTLVHAVTGAGKTEMLFALLAKCLALGRRACIATPRIDVVNELFPRLQLAFSQIQIGKYHGRQFHEPELDQLTICTTHQLLKFYQAFDLLIIDEVDSFPFVNSRLLHFAAKNAVKKKGVRTYLTATPSEDLKQAVKAGKIKLLQLHRRFHGGLLPVPREQFFWRPYLIKGQLHPLLRQQIKQVILQKHPLLLFVSRIQEIPAYLKALRELPELTANQIAGVYAGDPARLEKVERFRRGDLQVLVTTTILERGVTFKHVWVIVLAAEDEVFSAASLVQIAGRVGRDKQDKDGLVLFCYHRYHRQIREAVKQIKEMNR